MFQVIAVEEQDTVESLLARIQDGEEIVLTRRGSPIARVVPANSTITPRPFDPAAAEAAVQRINARREEMGKFDWEQLKQDRDTGRR